MCGRPNRSREWGRAREPDHGSSGQDEKAGKARDDLGKDEEDGDDDIDEDEDFKERDFVETITGDRVTEYTETVTATKIREGTSGEKCLVLTAGSEGMAELEVDSPTAEADRMKTNPDGEKQRSLVGADVINLTREEREDEKAATLTGMDVACADVDGFIGEDIFGRKASAPSWDAGLAQNEKNRGYDVVISQELQQGPFKTEHGQDAHGALNDSKTAQVRLKKLLRRQAGVNRTVLTLGPAIGKMNASKYDVTFQCLDSAVNAMKDMEEEEKEKTVVAMELGTICSQELPTA